MSACRSSTRQLKAVASPDLSLSRNCASADECRRSSAEAAASAALSSSARTRRAIGSPKLTGVLRRAGRDCQGASYPSTTTFDTAPPPFVPEKFSSLNLQMRPPRICGRQHSPDDPQRQQKALKYLVKNRESEPSGPCLTTPEPAVRVKPLPRTL